jgi:hypothetical protein
VLFGGGLAWLYVPRIEAYTGMDKVPPLSALQHRYDSAQSWLQNVIGSAARAERASAQRDGSLSNLPWDIAAQFQQHAVSIGLALTLVALFLFVTWQSRPKLQGWLMVANIVTCAILFLGNAVFATVTVVTLGLCLVWTWLRRPSRVAFIRGTCFTLGVGALAMLHGGMLSRGAQYGGGGFSTMRKTLGYALGGLGGFLHWNLAGFGVPLVLALLAWAAHRWRRERGPVERNLLFWTLTVFAVFAYSVPQVMYYSSETYGVEQFTEISKFFFSAHFGIALLSAFGLACLPRTDPRGGRTPAVRGRGDRPVRILLRQLVQLGRPLGGFLFLSVSSPFRRGGDGAGAGKAEARPAGRVLRRLEGRAHPWLSQRDADLRRQRVHHDAEPVRAHWHRLPSFRAGGGQALSAEQPHRAPASRGRRGRRLWLVLHAPARRHGRGTAGRALPLHQAGGGGHIRRALPSRAARAL